VTLAEVRLVLGRRLTELSVPPAGKRQGKVYVAEALYARGLSFDVVFAPGLAERLFPQKVTEDPLLRDGDREPLDGLERNEGRIARERLALRLAVGAAAERVVLSWPRLDLSQGRARVPSFYGLEVRRAAEGKLPSFSELSRAAEQAAGARAGWPAPEDPLEAVDEAEHDLALLARAMRLPPDQGRGTARYLLDSNANLRRALRARARRWSKKWTWADGLVLDAPDPTAPAEEEQRRAQALAALQAHQLTARSWSPTALQNYSGCPYKFVLQGLHRLAPREEPEAIDEIDPLERGSLIHKVQYRLLRELGTFDLDKALARLDPIVDEVAREWEERLAPAIARVWSDCVAGVKVDLREWLRRVSLEPRFRPWRYELAFGLAEDEERDPHSQKDPVAIDGVRLRGSIDLVERADDGSLRATDYKTGKAWAKPGVVIGGGATLQPALYALALERLFPGARVEGGRLWYCTFAGDYQEVPVPLDGAARGSVGLLTETIGQALSKGHLPAAPRDDRECGRCDYQPVCGPSEWQRTQRKPPDPPLVKLREMP
jgi:RecB family exonuclease